MPRLINENGYILQATEESTTALLSAVKTPSVTLNPGTEISEEHFTSLGLAYDISDNRVKCLQMNADGKLLCDVGNLTLNTGALSVDNSGVETGLSTVNTTLLGNLKIINGTNGSGDIPLTVTDSSLTGALNVTPLVASDNFTRNAIFASDPSTGRARIVECDNSGKLQVGVTGSVTATLSTIDNEAIDAITTAVSVGNVIAGTNSVSTGLASNVAHTKTVVVGVNSNNEGTPIKVDTDGKLITKSDPQSTTRALTAINSLIDRTVMVGHFPDNNTGVPLKVDGTGILQIAGTVELGTTDNTVLDTIAGDTTSLDDKISKGADETIDAATGAQQVLIYGIDGNDVLRGIQLDNSGKIKTNTNEGQISSTAAIGTTFARTALFASDGTHARVVNCDVSGNLQVDISEALPTGTNKIGSVGLVANTVQDGTGAEKNLVCDTNGKLLVSIPDEDYQQYPAIVTTVPSTDTITSVPVVNIPRYFTYSTLFSAITEDHSQSYDDNIQGFTNTIVTTGFTKISVVGKITNTFPDELSNVLRVELWPVFSSSPSEDDADNMIGPVASGLFIKDYLYFDTVELLYPAVKLRVVNEGIDDAVLNLRVYMRK